MRYHEKSINEMYITSNLCSCDLPSAGEEAFGNMEIMTHVARKSIKNDILNNINGRMHILPVAPFTNMV